MSPIGLGLAPAQRRPIDRSGDRRVAMASIVLAITYLCAALLAVLLPSQARVGLWLPLHLAVAGGAATAIAGVMPFFSAAFAAAPPTDGRLRWLSVASVASGSAIATAAYVTGALGLAAAGGVLFVVGIGLVGLATVRPLRLGLGPRGGLVTRGYLAALAMVALGAALAALYLWRWLPVVEAWAALRPAHAWLNLVGFVSVVIATTLLHFFPTVVGARIRRTPAAQLTVGGLAAGALLVALGYALRSDVLARAGALAVLLGALALAAYATQTWRARARWSTDAQWHRFAMGSLVSAIVWFEFGVLIAVGRVLVHGAEPVGASTNLLIGPLVVGWLGLTLVGSATHLVPAVGPGDPAAHARQRRLLGRGGELRILALNLGITATTIGLSAGLPPIAGAGLVLVALALAATASLIVVAIVIGVRAGSAASTPT